MNWNTPVAFLNSQIEVNLIGCGGTGSFVLSELSNLHELLHRLGHPGLKVIAWDGSVVREANLGRQRFRVSDLGCQKSTALIQAERAFNGFDWVAEAFFVPSPSSMRVYSSSPRIYITAVDKPSVRLALGKALVEYKMTEKAIWIDAGNDHATGQVIMGGAGLPNVCDLFGAQYAAMADSDSKSCSSEEAIAKQDFGVNSMAARLVGQLLWNALRHGGLDTHGAFFDVHRLAIEPLKIDPRVWATFGYEQPYPVAQ